MGESISIFYPFSWFSKIMGFVRDDGKKEKSAIKMALCWLFSAACLGVLLAAFLFVVFVAYHRHFGEPALLWTGKEVITYFLLLSYFTVGLGAVMFMAPYVAPSIVVGLVLFAVFLVMIVPILIMQIIKGDWEQLCSDLSALGVIGSLLAGLSMIGATFLLYKTGGIVLAILMLCLLDIPMTLAFLFGFLGAAVSLVLTIIKKERETSTSTFALIAGGMTVASVVVLMACVVAAIVSAIFAKPVFSFFWIIMFMVPTYGGLSMMLGIFGFVEALVQTIKGNKNMKGMISGGIAIGLPFVALPIALILAPFVFVVGVVAKLIALLVG